MTEVLLENPAFQQLNRLLNRPVELSQWPDCQNRLIVRGDLIHAHVSGNKLYKLWPCMQKLVQEKKSGLMSVGGRYSNHLHALAWLGAQLGVGTVGLVRGYASQSITPTLRDCQKWGMELHFIDHQTYQMRYQPSFWEPWLPRYDDSVVIEEGGWSEESIASSALWWQSIPSDVEVLICAIGSGTTFTGLAATAPKNTRVLGVPVYKDPEKYKGLLQSVQQYAPQVTDQDLWCHGTGPGFGRLSVAQKIFKKDFERLSNIELDPVYTTKLFYALEEHCKANPDFMEHKVAVLHSGGTQGNRT